MSDENKETVSSRRDFLKKAGVILGGGAVVGGLAGCADGADGKSAYEIAVENGFSGTEKEWLASLKGEKGDKGDKGSKGSSATSYKLPLADVPLTKGVLVVNEKICAGCNLCGIHCTLNKDGVYDPTVQRIIVDCFRLEEFYTAAQPCQQCADPQCMRYCPVGAITVDEKTGARVINQDYCIGCQECLKHCPFTPSRIRYDETKNKCTKCDLCGGDPECVKICPRGAIKYVTDPNGLHTGYDGVNYKEVED